MDKKLKKRMVSKKVEGGFILSGLEYLTSLGAWKQLPVGTKKLLEQYADWTVYTSMVTRKPVNSLTQTLVNVITAGRAEQFKLDKGFDDYFHLSTVLFLVNEKNVIKTLQYEKLDRPTIREIPKDANFQSKYIVKHSKSMTLAECIAKHMEKMGDNYYIYDSFRNNCQNFLVAFYKVTDELTPKLEAFVRQPADELVPLLPDYSKQLANTITNLGATVNNWLEYFGFKPFTGGMAPKRAIEAGEFLKELRARKRA
jgi:hypothetical protein